MVRYKGVSSKAVIRRNFPHDVLVPFENVGLKNTVAVDIFFAQIDQPKHSSWLRKDDADFLIYHFADPQHAASFQALFGGEVLKRLERRGAD